MLSAPQVSCRDPEQPGDVRYEIPLDARTCDGDDRRVQQDDEEAS